MPGGKSTMVKSPSSFVGAVRSRPVWVLVALTVAPVTAAPALSTTEPAICPELACDCAIVGMAPKASQSTSTNAHTDRYGVDFDIFLPLLMIIVGPATLGSG